MRVTTAFNRILRIPGANVAEIELESDRIVVRLRRRFRLLRCPCGQIGRGRYDASRRRWRHLDLAGCRLFFEAEIRRLWCPACRRVRTEEVPWARGGARHTRDFEDLVAWCAQRMDKTAVSRLLRTTWSAVDAIVSRVVADQIDQQRLEGLVRIGVDEVSWRRRHRYLTLVVDHDTGNVVWGAEGKDAATLARFFGELGPDRSAALKAVSLDLGGAFRSATQAHAPQARICLDPFHVVRLANEAVRAVQRHAPRNSVSAQNRAGRQLRWALVKDPAKLTASEWELLEQHRRTRSELWRAWMLKEDLRALYRLEDPSLSRVWLQRWLQRASRSRIRSMVALARTLRAQREGILAAIDLDLSNSRLEGLNARVRLINNRGFGHRSPAALLAMIFLCCGGIAVSLPFG